MRIASILLVFVGFVLTIAAQVPDLEATDSTDRTDSDALQADRNLWNYVKDLDRRIQRDQERLNQQEEALQEVLQVIGSRRRLNLFDPYLINPLLNKNPSAPTADRNDPVPAPVLRPTTRKPSPAPAPAPTRSATKFAILQDRVDALEDAVQDLSRKISNGSTGTSDAYLRSLLACVSPTSTADELVLLGCNVRIQSSGIAGRGNLLIGQQGRGCKNCSRTGSNNLIIGPNNDYTGDHAVIVGQENVVRGSYATLLGASGNTVTANHVAVVAGCGHVVSNDTTRWITGGDCKIFVGGRSDDHMCFDTTSELKAAVAEYLTNPTVTNVVSRIYGYPIGTWCVDNITDFSYLFASTAFDESIDNWNVSSATTMRGMFQGASRFNQSLASWADRISKVVDMSFMFDSVSAFNSNISTWNTASLQTMQGMFRAAISFNSDISAWSVSKVTNMEDAFLGANRFSSNLCRWGVQIRSSSFYNASSPPSTSRMFAGTDCPNQYQPTWTAVPPGPFCYNCV